MKKCFKISCVMLCFILVAGLLTGCGNEKQVSTNSTFTYWTSIDSNVAQTLSENSELLMYQEMMKRTGTDIKFIHPAQGSTGSEAFQILLASGDYPDMIEYSWDNYTGGPDQAIEDGVIIALNDYMEEYAPNYYNIMEGEIGKESGYRYKADTITSKGNYYGFKGVTIDSYSNFCGIMIRKDMLDKWGLDIPVTIDDWTNVFKVAKENGVKYPITGQSNSFSVTGRPLFENAWNVGKGFYVDNGKVKFGPFQSEYKAYLKQMVEWSKAGYIDIDFVTNDATMVEGQMTNGTSIACFGYISAIGKLFAAMQDRDPGYNVVACPFPVMNEGDIAPFKDVMSNTTQPTITISTQCGADNEDRYKEAIKFCDYLYSEEGKVLKNFGIEGETFEIVKGEDGADHYVYTDKVTNYEEFGGTSMSAGLYHFMLPANHPGYNQHPDYLDGFYEFQQQKDALRKWNENIDIARTHNIPESLSYTGDEASRKANIETSGYDNINAAIFNIILGKQSFDEFDKLVVEQAKKDGFDELTEIIQASYDRYCDAMN